MVGLDFQTGFKVRVIHDKKYVCKMLKNENKIVLWICKRFMNERNNIYITQYQQSLI